MSDFIQWPAAKYWTKCFNPIIGCRKLSPACEHCYAESLVRRFNMTGHGCENGGFEPTRTLRGKTIPQHGIVFCGNMTDLFGSWVSPEEQGKWFEEANLAIDEDGFNEAAYLWLTKRPGNMAHAITDNYEFISQGAFFGITAENQEYFDRRMVQLIPQFHPFIAQDYWISCEPLLGPIDLRLLGNNCFIRWVVVGCESGPQRRPCRLEWVESIVDQCKVFNIPVFVKQLDLDGECVTDIEKFPQHLRIRQVPWRVK